MTTPPAPRRRARRGEGERLRGELLTAATTLLAETGDADAVSIRAVAARAGVSTPSVYLHFADKQTLLDAACDAVFAALDGAMRDAAAQADGPLDALFRRGVAYVRFALANAEHYRIVMMGRPQPAGSVRELEDLVTSRAFTGLLDAVRDCVSSGIMHGDVTAIALRLWACAHGTASLMIAKPALPYPADFVDSAIRGAGIALLAEAGSRTGSPPTSGVRGRARLAAAAESGLSAPRRPRPVVPRPQRRSPPGGE